MKVGSLEMLSSVAKPIASASETFDCFREVMVSSPHRRFSFFDYNEGPATLYLTESLYFEGCLNQPLTQPTPFQQIIEHCRRINPSDDWQWLTMLDLLASVDEHLEIRSIRHNPLAYMVSTRVVSVLNGGSLPPYGQSLALSA